MPTLFEKGIQEQSCQEICLKKKTQINGENGILFLGKYHCLMFKNIAFELCLNGNFSCDGDRNVKHLIQELSRVDSDVQDYEWDLSKNDFTFEELYKES